MHRDQRSSRPSRRHGAAVRLGSRGVWRVRRAGGPYSGARCRPGPPVHRCSWPGVVRDVARLAATQILGGGRGIAIGALDDAIGWLCRGHDARAARLFKAIFARSRPAAGISGGARPGARSAALARSTERRSQQTRRACARDGRPELDIRRPDSGMMQGQIGTGRGVPSSSTPDRCCTAGSRYSRLGMPVTDGWRHARQVPDRPHESGGHMRCGGTPASVTPTTRGSHGRQSGTPA
jgi:hypothetical protein